MGVDIHTHLCKYNQNDNLWHELKLYRKDMNDSGEDEYKKVPVYTGRDSEMFSAMLNEEKDNYGHFPCANIPLLSLEEDLKKEIAESTTYYYGFREILLSDMKYYLKDHPTVIDYDEDWSSWKAGDSKPKKINPIKYLFDSCCSYGEFAEGLSFGIDPLSRYKLLYWFDN